MWKICDVQKRKCRQFCCYSVRCSDNRQRNLIDRASMETIQRTSIIIIIEQCELRLNVMFITSTESLSCWNTINGMFS